MFSIFLLVVAITTLSLSVTGQTGKEIIVNYYSDVMLIPL